MPPTAARRRSLTRMPALEPLRRSLTAAIVPAPPPDPAPGPTGDGPVARSVAAGVEVYDRRRMLRRLLPLAIARVDGSTVGEEAEEAGNGILESRRICALLARALRSERNRGRAGHWSYDLNRHIGLLQAYRAERARLKGGPTPQG